MNMRNTICTMIAILVLLIAGCAAPTCYPPSKIIGKACCLDEDDNSVCDYEEQSAETEETVEMQAAPEEELADEPAQEVKETEVAVEAPAEDTKLKYVFGKQDMILGEPRTYLEVNKMLAYRNSRDRGMFEYMIITIRNPGKTTITPTVEMIFENARIEEATSTALKEFKFDALKPGEKLVVKQNLGIKFDLINKSRSVTLSMYNRLSSPRVDLGKLEFNVVPTDYMESMEIFTYGLPEYR
ncbi:MAG: hypothetical protein V1729_02240 [Candidatus Woesearchaeota archaeon]